MRKHDIHTGVDLYVPDTNLSVYSVESGTVVSVEDFTGPQAGSPWWLSTKALLVKGDSGVVCYGEIAPLENVKVGDEIGPGQRIGAVVQVLPFEKHRPDIAGHSCFMLHFELYTPEIKTAPIWDKKSPKPHGLLDPTKNLLKALERQRNDRIYQR